MKKVDAVLPPGPSDYTFDPNLRLRRKPSATIGAAKKVSCLGGSGLSPGPSKYEPKRLNWKKRAAVVIFNREKRRGFNDMGALSPGPGSYMIPCQFYNKPKFMYANENKFRFV